jgi:hypothetical protein
MMRCLCGNRPGRVDSDSRAVSFGGAQVESFGGPRGDKHTRSLCVCVGGAQPAALRRVSVVATAADIHRAACAAARVPPAAYVSAVHAPRGVGELARVVLSARPRTGKGSSRDGTRRAYRA